MQPDEIIKQFRLYTGDMTELSNAEEYNLLTKVLNELYRNRDWEFLRKTASVTLTTNTSGPLPADFSRVMMNYIENEDNRMPDKAVAFVSGYPIEFIPKGSASYLKGRYAYIDLVAKTVVVTEGAATGTAVTFDYKYVPAKITDNTGVIAIPSEFHDQIAQVMAIDNDIIEKTEGGRSNIVNNSLIKANLIKDLSYLNARMLNL